MILHLETIGEVKPYKGIIADVFINALKQYFVKQPVILAIKLG